MTQVKRSEWGAAPPRKTATLNSPRGVAIHWVGVPVIGDPYKFTSQSSAITRRLVAGGTLLTTRSAPMASASRDVAGVTGPVLTVRAELTEATQLSAFLSVQAKRLRTDTSTQCAHLSLRCVETIPEH